MKMNTTCCVDHIYCLVADTPNKTELGRLLQLILGCAVNCEDKQGGVISE